MRILVDADACPRAVRDILFRAANRRSVRLTLVANQYIRTPPSPHIESVQVPRGFDVADNHIVELARAGDLVITGDIPLADAVVAKGAVALSPRGDLFTAENVRERLALRDVADQLRSSGAISGGPPPPGRREQQAFANQLDRYLSRHRSGK